MDLPPPPHLDVDPGPVSDICPERVTPFVGLFGSEAWWWLSRGRCGPTSPGPFVFTVGWTLAQLDNDMGARCFPHDCVYLFDCNANHMKVWLGDDGIVSNNLGLRRRGCFKTPKLNSNRITFTHEQPKIPPHGTVISFNSNQILNSAQMMDCGLWGMWACNPGFYIRIVDYEVLGQAMERPLPVLASGTPDSRIKMPHLFPLDSQSTRAVSFAPPHLQVGFDGPMNHALVDGYMTPEDVMTFNHEDRSVYNSDGESTDSNW